MKTEDEENEIKEEEFIKKITESCEKIPLLKKTDNISRRNILKEIQSVLKSSNNSILLRSNLDSLLGNVIESLISILSDDSEKCREISATILKDIFQRVCVIERDLPPLLSVLVQRLGKTDEREQSEEVRIIEINLVYHLIENYDGDLLQCLNDITTILSICTVDECPEIKRRSCECIFLLASKQNSHFHMVGKTFLKPLLCTISHQHLKTRALCIKALGSIVDHLNSEEFEQAISHLAQRLLDRSPVVRMSATEAVGKMLITLKDRYSYFHRLIPLMLSSLYDEVQEIRSKAQELWNRAGNQYLQENENDYKDLIDFPRPDPENYPVADFRPSLGCRTLVQRNIFNIISALIYDMEDWLSETRIKSSKVLFSLILHAENKITIKLPSALEAIVCGAKDEEKEVVEQAIKSAELLGYFIDPNLLCDSILSLAHKGPSAVHLCILAAVLRGHKRILPNECFTAICKFLSNPDISRFRQTSEQASLLLCIEGLLSSGNQIDLNIGYNIFTMLASISGLTTSDSVLSKANDLLKKLAERQSCSEELLFKKHVVPLVKTLTENNELWTYQSPEMPIFYFVAESGCLDEDMIELIFPVFINNLHPSKDAKLRSKILTLLIPVFKKLSSSDYGLLSEKILDLIRSGIFPNLTWSAGKTARALRTVTLASLYEIINRNCLKKELLISLGDELLPIIGTLSEDDAVRTRLLSYKILEISLPELIGSLDDLKIHKTCFEILHGLDDESDDIRLMTIRVLKAYVMSFPAAYNWKLYRSHLKNMFENVLIHMDDKNEQIKQSSFDLLKEVAFAAPDILLEEIESKKYVMSASDLCDNLIEHIRNIKL